MTEPHIPTTAPAHARHDPELIAALAAREPNLSARELATARSLVDECTDCRDLLADLLVLQVALPASETPARPRDFSLTDADAQRLRGTGWRRVMRFIGSSRDAFSRPLAIGFTTIGAVVLLITALPSIPLGGAGGAATLSAIGAPVTEQAAPAAASPAASAAAASAPAGAVPAAAPSAAPSAAPELAASPAASDAVDRQSVTAEPEPYGGATDEGGVFTGSNEGDGRAGDVAGSEDTAGDSGLLSLRDDGLSLGVVLGGISLIIGFGLFALRWTSRRFGDG
jgi:hypothetical protein